MDTNIGTYSRIESISSNCISERLSAQGSARNAATEYRHALPDYPLAGLDVLDVGCNDGAAFLHPSFAGATRLTGIDVDAAAIARGKQLYPHLELVVAPAEAIPFPDASFDVGLSRVALPYTHIPTALGEFRRVLRRRGRLFLSMHDLRLQMEWFRAALNARAWKRIVDHAYIFPASALFNTTGMCLPRPWNARFETIQTRSRMFKELERAGFTDVTSRRIGHHWIVEGVAK